MPPSFDELQNGKSNTVIFAEMLADLAGLDFPVTDWNDGAVPKSELDAWSRALSRAYTSVAAITNGGFLYLAPDSWLPVLAKNLYGVIPFPADYALGEEQFTVAPGNGPYTIRGGQTILQTEDGLRYFTANVAPIIISSAAPVWIPIKAESPGSKYNVLEGRINQLATSLPGVTVNNVPKVPALTWITNFGLDAETKDQIIERCKARFGRLSKLQNYPVDGYISLVRDSVPQVKKVSVYTNYYQGTARPGCATLFLAGDSGPVSPIIVAQTIAALRPYRNPLGTLFIESCIGVNQIVEGLVQVDPGFDFTAIRSQIDAQLLDYQRSAAIGARIYAAEIIERVMSPLGVRNYVPGGLTDLLLGQNQVVQFISRLEITTVQ